MQRRRPSALQPRGLTTLRRMTMLSALVIGLLATVVMPRSARADESRYFLETRHNVPAFFANYWAARGGLERFGLPLTEPYTENGLTVQYFERARFERHPENRDTPYEVLLGQLGREVRPPDPPTIPVGGINARFFTETGHNLALFRAYWERNDGLEQFGLPITEELKEVSSEDGKSYTVQYFERARLEYHPEKRGTPFEVSLGQLGRERYNVVKATNPKAAAAGAPADPPVTAATPASGIEQLMWQTVNQDRATAGVPPLALDPLLSQAAAVHVADMIANDFIEHTGSDGSRPIDRMRRAGARVQWASENIAMECAKDPTTAVKNIQGWMMAEPLSDTDYNHRWNLVYKGYTRIGIAFGVAKNGCWVMAEEFADGEPAPGSQR